MLFPQLLLSLGLIFSDLEDEFVAAGWQSGSLLQYGALRARLFLNIPKRLNLIPEVRRESLLRCEEGLLQGIAMAGSQRGEFLDLLGGILHRPLKVASALGLVEDYSHVQHS